MNRLVLDLAPHLVCTAAKRQHGDCPDFRAQTGYRPGTDAGRWSAMVGIRPKMGLSPS
jgi:hypothetical protein